MTQELAELDLDATTRLRHSNENNPLNGRGLEGTIDLESCNPPYISSARLESERSGLLAHNPREAFDCGPYRLSIHQPVRHDATEFLRPSGWLMLEIGVGQKRQFELLLKRKRMAYGAIRRGNDELGRPRVAAPQRTEPGSQVKHMETVAKLRAFIKQNFYAAQKLDIALDDSLLDLGIIDSTGVLELVAYLEEQFNLTIVDGDIVPENLDSVGAMLQFLQRKGVAS